MGMKRIEEDEVLSIVDHFQEIEDPRSTINRRHLLIDVIVISICGVVAGADGPKAIGIWAHANERWLRRHLKLPYGIPSHDTIGRVLAALKPSAFQECFQSWISSLRHQESGNGPEIIAIDGKALRRSHDHRKDLKPLFLVSAWAVDQGLTLGQLATAEKSNEITAIPLLLDQIDVRDAVVTIDAAGCQKNIAAKIIDGGGQYILSLKGNQGNLRKGVENWITAQMENDFADVAVSTLEKHEKGHGRQDHFIYHQFNVPEELVGRNKWKGLRTIGVAIRISRQNDEETCDCRYYISSLKRNVKQFARGSRRHWGIENTLHWCLDMTFREDESRLRDR